MGKKFGSLEMIVREERGEDIPCIIERCDNAEAMVFGITGEDLLADYLIKEFGDSPARYERQEDLIAARLDLRNKGLYEKTAFGLPALCILGKGGMLLDDFIETYPPGFGGVPSEDALQPDFRGKTVAIPRKYAQLIQSRVKLEGAYLLLLDGKVDVTAARRDSDYAIDIVLSGGTCRKESLGIFPPIVYLSDGVVLGNNSRISNKF